VCIAIRIIMKTASRSLINIVFFALGLVALVLLTIEVGPGTLWEQLTRVGIVFIPILLTELASNLASARGWYFAFSPESRPAYGKTVISSIAALSVSGALPTGQAGEFVKGNLMRGQAPATEIVSSLIWYNYLHVLMTSAAVFFAAIIPVAAGAFEPTMRYSALGLAAIILLVTAAILVLLRLHMLEKIIRWLQAHLPAFLKPSDRIIEPVRTVDQRLSTFMSEHPADFIRSNAWLLIGRLLNILEVWIILTALDLPNGVATVAMVYAATSMANYLLMVLPAREGFLEGSTYLIFGMLGLASAAGLSFEIVRRLRKIFYQILGLILLLSLSPKRKEQPAEDVSP